MVLAAPGRASFGAPLDWIVRRGRDGQAFAATVLATPQPSPGPAGAALPDDAAVVGQPLVAWLAAVAASLAKGCSQLSRVMAPHPWMRGDWRHLGHPLVAGIVGHHLVAPSLASAVARAMDGPAAGSCAWAGRDRQRYDYFPATPDVGLLYPVGRGYPVGTYLWRRIAQETRARHSLAAALGSVDTENRIIPYGDTLISTQALVIGGDQSVADTASWEVFSARTDTGDEIATGVFNRLRCLVCRQTGSFHLVWPRLGRDAVSLIRQLLAEVGPPPAVDLSTVAHRLAVGGTPPGDAAMLCAVSTVDAAVADLERRGLLPAPYPLLVIDGVEPADLSGAWGDER